MNEQTQNTDIFSPREEALLMELAKHARNQEELDAVRALILRLSDSRLATKPN
jgi:hypothetical protein